MTIDEIHIKVRQDLQKLDSHANGNLLDEEIDFHLNYFTRKFVDNVVGNLKKNPSTSTDFQHNQRLLDSLNTLQVKNHKLNTYVDSSDTNLVYGILPSNYRHLISDASELVYDCSAKPKNQIDSRVYIYPLSFLADYDTFNGLELKKEEVTLFDLSDYLPYTDGLDGAEVKYQLIKLILDNVPGIYWEYYNGKYYKNSFIYITDTSSNLSVTIGDETLFYSSTLVLNKIYRYNSTDKTIRRPNRIIKDANLDFIRNHPYEKTTWEFPISSLGNGVLYVYEDDEFKVRTISIDYLREPIQVSYSMSVNSDLPDVALQQVIETTMLHLKGMIQDPTWQTTMQNNQLNNQ